MYNRVEFKNFIGLWVLQTNFLIHVPTNISQLCFNVYIFSQKAERQKILKLFLNSPILPNYYPNFRLHHGQSERNSTGSQTHMVTPLYTSLKTASQTAVDSMTPTGYFTTL